MNSPPGPNVFAAALDWLDATLLGSLASAIAIVAIASVGFLLLAGRIDLRRSSRIILGCFILFGASKIAAGIVAAMNGQGGVESVQSPPRPPAYPTTAAVQNSAAAAYDPYAGAAVPTRR